MSPLNNSSYKIHDVKFLPTWFNLILLTMMIILVNALIYAYTLTCSVRVKEKSLVQWVSNFENFNNNSGSDKILVPNIVHFLRLDQPDISFTDAVCILAALKHHGPDHIYIHSNSKDFTGKYWKYLLTFKEFQRIYKIKPIFLPLTIFGQTFSFEWYRQHASDITRIRILIQYGGIFLDNDSFIVNNLTKYRYFEMSLGWNENKYLGTQVLIAHPDARFLKLWLESYRDNYNSSLWYFNAGDWPTISILDKKPELVKRVQIKFGVDINISPLLYEMYSDEWKKFDTFHLLINHRYYLDKDNFDLYPEFDDANILKCNVTFCVMAQEVYFGK